MKSALLQFNFYFSKVLCILFKHLQHMSEGLIFSIFFLNTSIFSNHLYCSKAINKVSCTSVCLSLPQKALLRAFPLSFFTSYLLAENQTPSCLFWQAAGGCDCVPTFSLFVIFTVAIRNMSLPLCVSLLRIPVKQHCGHNCSWHLLTKCHYLMPVSYYHLFISVFSYNRVILFL